MIEKAFHQIMNTKKMSNILIIGVITPQNSMVNIQSYFDEFVNLVKTRGIVPAKELFIKIRVIHPGTFFSKGKVEEIGKICREYQIDEVVISESISSHQENNLEKIWQVTLFDRTSLILEIFEKRARSAEAKLQTKIAFLEHKKTRVAGRGTHFSQQRGGVGLKGPGETQKEIDLQHIDHLLVKLQKDLRKLQQIRETQRKRRIKNSCSQIALVGYTNAGKSTLFNALANDSVFVEDKLFATLDTTTRELYHGNKKIGVLSDTVGFIQQLPPQLIDAFKSTLDEISYADIILHVIDVHNNDWKMHRYTVEKILLEIGIKESAKVIQVYNKIDLLSEGEVSKIGHGLDKDQYVFTNAYDERSIKEVLILLANKIPSEDFFY